MKETKLLMFVCSNLPYSLLPYCTPFCPPPACQPLPSFSHFGTHFLPCAGCRPSELINCTARRMLEALLRRPSPLAPTHTRTHTHTQSRIGTGTDNRTPTGHEADQRLSSSGGGDHRTGSSSSSSSSRRSSSDANSSDLSSSSSSSSSDVSTPPPFLLGAHWPRDALHLQAMFHERRQPLVLSITRQRQLACPAPREVQFAPEAHSLREVAERRWRRREEAMERERERQREQVGRAKWREGWCGVARLGMAT